MAERPEDLNLPNSVVSKIIKEAVCILCSALVTSLCINSIICGISSTDIFQILLK